jgi:hypothetical protein
LQIAYRDAKDGGNNQVGGRAGVSGFPSLVDSLGRIESQVAHAERDYEDSGSATK